MSVKVAIRCRPLNTSEKKAEAKAAVTVDANDNKISLGSRTRQFDHAWAIGESQETVYNDVGAPLVEQFVQGSNVCIATYGAMGSGKSWTTMGAGSNGSPEQQGLISRMLDAVVVAKQTGASLTCSIFEIYNDKCFDLLLDEKKVGGPRHRGVMALVMGHPKNLTKRPITSGSDFNVLAEMAFQRVHGAKGPFNLSHKIVEIQMGWIDTHRQKQKRMKSTLCFLDLAVANRVDRLVEASGFDKKTKAKIHQASSSVNFSLTSFIRALRRVSQLDESKLDKKEYKRAIAQFSWRDSTLSAYAKEWILSGPVLLIGAIDPINADNETESTLCFLSQVVCQAPRAPCASRPNQPSQQQVLQREARRVIEQTEFSSMNITAIEEAIPNLEQAIGAGAFKQILVDTGGLSLSDAENYIRQFQDKHPDDLGILPSRFLLEYKKLAFWALARVVRDLASTIDVDHDGQISHDEVVNWMRPMAANAEELAANFLQVADLNGDHMLTVAEIEQAYDRFSSENNL
jgi:hypothetical protein